MSEKWLSIIDYASYRGISISTIRRYIKSNQLKTKKIKGKFYIYTQGDFANPITKLKDKSESLNRELEHLKKENTQLKDEITDLKMLIQVMDKYIKNKKLPDLPEVLLS